MSGAILIALAGCASDYPEYEKVHSLTFKVRTSEPQAQAVKLAEDPTDPSTWSVRCVSLDEEGVGTNVTSTYDEASGEFLLENIPHDTDTVCHLVGGEGELLATISVSDSGALGGSRDVFRITSNTQATVIYDAVSEIALAYSGSFIFGEGDDRADLHGRWGIGCNEVRDIVTDEILEDVDCTDEVEGEELFLHRITATGPSGELRMAYGIWRSEAAFAACGSTEGIDSLPFGWSLHVDSVGSDAPFAWSQPFDGLASSSSSEEIIGMIKSCDEGDFMSFEQFMGEYGEDCQTDSRCAARYYYQMRDHGIANPTDHCWPHLVFTFDDDGGVAAALWPSKGGGSKPLGMLHFLEAFQYGNETYMRGEVNQVREVVSGSDQVGCKLKEEFLMAVEIPDADGDGVEDVDEDEFEIKAADGDMINVGTRLQARYRSSTKVASITGDFDNLCQQELGEVDEVMQEGVYTDVVLESVTAE